MQLSQSGWASRLSRLGVHHRFGIGHSGVAFSHWAPDNVQAERNRHLPISQINCPDEQVVPDPARLLPRAIAEGSIPISAEIKRTQSIYIIHQTL